MSRNSYQTYTPETPIEIFRSDAIRRQAMCTALGSRYPAFADIATQAGEIVADIDAHHGALRSTEDDAVRAKAVEDAEKIDVIDAYATLRGMMGVRHRANLFNFLPEPPSTLGRYGSKKFGERMAQAISNLLRLPEDDPLRREYLPTLQAEMDGFQRADQTEDSVRIRSAGDRLDARCFASSADSSSIRQITTATTTSSY